MILVVDLMRNVSLRSLFWSETTPYLNTDHSSSERHTFSVLFRYSLHPLQEHSFFFLLLGIIFEIHSRINLTHLYWPSSLTRVNEVVICRISIILSRMFISQAKAYIRRGFRVHQQQGMYSLRWFDAKISPMINIISTSVIQTILQNT